MMLPVPLLSLATLALATVTNVRKRATTCNGRSELCDRSYGNTTFLMSHDSFAISTNILNPSRTQQVSLTDQLGKYGVRALQAQAHMNGKVLHFCHTSCILFDGGSVLDYLKTVKAFIDKNPDEVYTLLFTNPEGVNLTIWDQVFIDSGIKPLTYVPPKYPLKNTEWPTLGEMIDAGTKVVVFMASGTDTANFPYILPEFDFIWEPPFSSTDKTFPCKVDRISGSLAPEEHMHMINHNLNTRLISLPFDFSARVMSSLANQSIPLSHLSTEALRSEGMSLLKSSSITTLTETPKSNTKIVRSVKQRVPRIEERDLEERSLEILVPNFFDASTTNGMASILQDSNGCAPLAAGKSTNFVMIDWVDIGDGKKTVDYLNGF